MTVKIKWDDGEQATCKRNSLATRPIGILDADEDPTTDSTSAAEASPSLEETPAAVDEPATPIAEQPKAEPTTTELPAPSAGPTADAQTPAPPEPTAEVQAPVPTETVTDVQTAAPGKSKRERKPKVATEPKEKKVSALDTAARVSAEVGTAMTWQEMIDVMSAKAYWTSPGAKTPATTVYSAILREVDTKG